MYQEIKLLILCQKVDSNDDLLGFFHDWIAEFAKNCQQVTVICLYKGVFDLPNNVKVLSMGKERNFQLFKKIRYFLNFFHYIWAERNNYNSVFIHMNHEYIVLAGWWWRLMGKKIILWHAHKSVNWKLRLSEKLVDTIVTSTKSGCRLDSKKIRIVGQGIDVNKFKDKSFSRPELETKAKLKVNEDIFKIISVGRISPIKDYETLINAVGIVQSSGLTRRLAVEIVGGAAVPEDEIYLNKLKATIEEKGLEGTFKFIGSVPNNNIISYLQNADLFINTSLTGSLDKAVLEAMAIGLPVLTCNEAYLDVLEDYRDKLMFAKGNFQDLTDKMLFIINLDTAAREKMAVDLRDIVVRNHNLGKLTLNILKYCH